ncbi:hypothetical protein F4553_005060 [Allocatelliglobosispora scoriae]|uniref:SMODS-associating 2TM beta-strand rich effector domain-containing protein n=1 Tax=Allocatelliglobosispora scoriae TaxID=643052 RepID=A0A841BYD1_9ACTN|nr:hypothetical protein [Allocatelliglobosispora scoriae]MBB5871681.1 hypothetical protein [Allocatelliglobosispora scoriae]
MGFLHALLRDRNIDGVRQMALAGGAVLFSVLNSVTLAFVRPSGLGQTAVAAIVSAFSLAVIVRTLQLILLRWWAHPILGEWVYESSSGNWGLARLDIRGGDLRYTVQLYRTQADTLAAVRQEPGFVAKCFATVTSVGATYLDGQVELVYKIGTTTQEGYAPRSGMLTLSPLSYSAMKGYWRSDIQGSEPSRGVLDMYRPNTSGSSGGG